MNDLIVNVALERSVSGHNHPTHTVINKRLLMHPHGPLLEVAGRTSKKHVLTATYTIEYLYSYVVNRLVRGAELIAYYID
jgi:hypothetical protein